MGASTRKKGSETSEFTSPLTANTRAVKLSTEATAESSKTVNGSADRAVNPQSGNRSEALKPRNRDIDTSTITDRDKVPISSPLLSDIVSSKQRSLQAGDKV
jgi:hypothetical protein